MLRNRKIDANSRLCQHQMAAHLPAHLPAGFLKRLGCVLSQNVRQLAQTMPFPRPMICTTSVAPPLYETGE